MNPFIQYILISKYSSKHHPRRKWTYNPQSKYSNAKSFREWRIIIKNQVKSFILLSLGVLSASFGLHGFLIPNRLIDGGVTGISLLVSIVSHLPLSILLIVINLPFIFLGLKQSGKGFALKSILSIGALAIVLATVHFPIITDDKLLIAVFGGFFLGAGIGLAIRGGGVLDGTEILAIFVSRKTGMSVGDIILIINIIIFSFAGYFLGIEVALYSVLIYLAASKTVDFILQGFEEYTGVTIISHRSDTIRLMIMNKLNKGVTVYKGSRGFGKRGEVVRDIDILYTIVTRFEIARLMDEIQRIDPEAFVVMNPIKDIRGGMIRKHFELKKQ